MDAKRLLLLAMLLSEIFMLPNLRAQYLDGFVIAPTKPTTADLVTITVHGALASTGVQLVDSSIFSFGNGFEIDLYVVADSGVSLPILLPFRRSFGLGKLPAGNYSIRAQSFCNYELFDTAGTSFVVEEPLRVEQELGDMGRPTKMILNQNHPNPFNPSTTIAFDLPQASEVTLKIFDLVGHEVATLAEQKMQAGRYSFNWDASGLPGGVYFYRLQTEAFTQTRKLLLLR